MITPHTAAPESRTRLRRFVSIGLVLVGVVWGRHARGGRSLAAPLVVVGSAGSVCRVAVGPRLRRTRIRPGSGPDDDRHPGRGRATLLCPRWPFLAGDAGGHVHAGVGDDPATHDRHGRRNVRGSPRRRHIPVGRLPPGPPERAARRPSAVRWLELSRGRAPVSLRGVRFRERRHRCRDDSGTNGPVRTEPSFTGSQSGST